MIIVKEISIGLAAGLIMTIWFSAAALAGEKIASTAGLGFAAQMDPARARRPRGQSDFEPAFGCLVPIARCAFAGDFNHFEVLRNFPIAYSPDLGVLIASGIEAAGMMFFAAAMIMLP